MTETIDWIDEESFQQSLELSITRYKYVEADFLTCLEYIRLTEAHLKIYSSKLADTAK